MKKRLRREGSVPPKKGQNHQHPAPNMIRGKELKRIEGRGREIIRKPDSREKINNKTAGKWPETFP